MEKSNNKAKNIIISIAIVGGFLGMVLLIMILVSNPKEPATAEQVWDVMVAQGYQPEDITERYKSQDPDIQKCVAFQENDVHFEFFVFGSKERAINAYGTFYTEIILNKNEFAKVEHKTKIANYTIYTLKVSGTYNVAIYVENTAVYAYCNEENAHEIGDILTEIGYFS